MNFNRSFLDSWNPGKNDFYKFELLQGIKYQVVPNLGVLYGSVYYGSVISFSSFWIETKNTLLSRRIRLIKVGILWFGLKKSNYFYGR